MNKTVILMISAGLFSTPVHAAELSNVQVGAFAGFRLTIVSRNGVRPTAGLTVAPTQTQLSTGAPIGVRIGEGVALNFAPHSEPTLTLGGVRADAALGLRRVGHDDAENDLGVSTGGWIAIGVGSAALILGGLYLAADHIADCDEGECD